MPKLQGKTAVGLAKTATDEKSSTPCDAETKKQATKKAKKPKNPENINKTGLPSGFDVMGGTDIAPETVTAVNATITPSFDNESEKNDDVLAVPTEVSTGKPCTMRYLTLCEGEQFITLTQK